MATPVVLETFESYEPFDIYEGSSGSGWLVSTGPADPRIESYSDPQLQEVPAPPGLTGDRGVILWTNVTTSLSVSVSEGDGVGLWQWAEFDSSAAHRSHSLEIGWTTDGAYGGVEFAFVGLDLEVVQWREGPDGYEESVALVAVESDPVLIGGEPYGDWRNVWLEISVHRKNGWTVRNPATDSSETGASPWPISSRGVPWSMSLPAPGNFGSRVVDDIYMFAPTSASAVRLFPRDDGRGMSSAPRIHPAPKSGRIIGGYQ